MYPLVYVKSMAPLHSVTVRYYYCKKLWLSNRAFKSLAVVYKGIIVSRSISSFKKSQPTVLCYRFNVNHIQIYSFHIRTTERGQEASSKVEETVKSIKEEKKKQSEKIQITDVVKISDKALYKKQSLWQRVKVELLHYYHGFRLLGLDMKVSAKLIWRILQGYDLNRREHRLLVKTTGDVFRLIPFSVFIIVPFMEFLLPIAIKIFPGLLPSTFQTSTEKEDKLKQALKIDVERRITSVSCTCVYNKSGKCKHVAALIYYINNEEGLTKTNKEQQWEKPTVRQLTKEKYSKGRYFFQMFPPQEKKFSKDSKTYEIDISELEGPSPLKSVLIECLKKDSEEGVIKSLMSSMLDQVVISVNKEECIFCVSAFFTFCESKQVYMTIQKLSKELKDFYKNWIVLSEDEIIKLCCDTMQQSRCDRWFEARLLRISASKDVHNVKIRKTKTVESLVNEMLNPVRIETAATRYGKDNESVAKEQYQHLFKYSVKNVGVIVSKSQPWLCASLDGFVVQNNNISKIVEFKCPYSCRNVPIVDYVAKKCNVIYLQFEGDIVQLKKSAMYYTQCQSQMYVSGVDTCDLFIYSPVENGSFCLVVHRNETFIKQVIMKCEHFYFKNYLPSLYVKKTACHFTGKDISNTM